MIENIEWHICRICGYQSDEPFWLITWWPSFEICPCCWSESWYHDLQQSAIEKNRQRWLEEWYKWFDEKEKTKNWNLEEQMNKIPEQYL
jgi:hypothetical protein